MKRKVKLLSGMGAVAVIGILVVCLCFIGRSHGEEETVYRETKVAYGNLTVGITEEATVKIGTLEQRFDLDISALVDSGRRYSRGLW